MKFTAIGWGIWTGGIACIIAVDYAMRIVGEDARFGGIPPTSQSVFLALLAIPSIWFLFKGTTTLQVWLAAVVIVVQGFVGFWMAVYFFLFYVCTAGIDCI